MIFFKNVEIENFGPISHKQIEFSKGVNLIKGFNASGKTQAIGTLIFSILGKSVVNLNFNTDLTSKIKLQLSDEYSIQNITSKIDYDNGKKRVIQNVNPEDSKLQSILKESLVDYDIPCIYFDSFHVLNKITNRNFKEFESRFPSLTSSGSWQNLIKYSENTNGVLSEGANYLLKLLSFYLEHQKSILKLPLILDNWHMLMDSDSREILYTLLFELGKTHQIIYTGFELPDEKFLNNSEFKYTEMHLEKERQISPINFNYNLPTRRKAKKKRKDENRFYLGKKFESDENLNIEFKEVKGKNPKSSIKSIADQYIVAYLNSIDNKVGRIYWGVKDENKEIVGVEFSQADRDDIRKTLSELFLSIKPEITPSSFSIVFHQVYKNDKSINDLYLLEIVIPPIHSKYLYSTSKGEVYIKTDAGKKKLSIMQIQLELEQRIKADNNVYSK
jgi:hypothetical protein